MGDGLGPPNLSVPRPTAAMLCCARRPPPEILRLQIKNQINEKTFALGKKCKEQKKIFFLKNVSTKYEQNFQ